jgi:hypothetical protein
MTPYLRVIRSNANKKRRVGGRPAGNKAGPRNAHRMEAIPARLECKVRADGEKYGRGGMDLLEGDL